MKPKRVSWLRLILIASAVTFFTSCSPYAGVDIGVPFNVGPIRVNPSIGFGGFL
jgi:hypothetical protein